MSYDLEIVLNLSLGSIFIIGSYLFLRRFISALTSARLNKISLSGGEIEMSKDLDTSILNKYFDEILYFLTRLSMTSWL